MSTSSQLPANPIPILSNKRINLFREIGKIRIEPFNEALLAPTAYQLRPHAVRYQRRDDDSIIQRGQCILSDAPYLLRPHEHVVVSIQERIVLGDGVVGDFFPASYCAENRLSLIAGRLDAKYDRAIVFGLLNCSEDEVRLTSDLQIARISFAWLGVDNLPEYGGKEPGSYIPELTQLRMREIELRNELDSVQLNIQAYHKGESE